MASISKSQEIHASVNRVWRIISELNNEPKYWTSIRDIKVLRENGNLIEREATVGPSGFSQRTRQTIVLTPKKSIKLSMSGDTIAGERTITLAPRSKNNTTVDVKWSFELKGVPEFVQGIVKNQISKVTAKALAMIAEEAERP